MNITSLGRFASEISYSVVQELTQKAVEAQEHSYCPYSHYKVSAAVLTENGKIFTGCNVENATYPAGCCAERTAIFKAVSEGSTDIKAIAIVLGEGGSPCGICRQVINEFNPEAYIFCANREGQIFSEHKLNEILPLAFGPKQLLG